ncbi:MAG TPA: glycosyltransferase family 2 protein [Flavisolibacter sp.]|nr:glycosyltransferase family 2 protein [Flavisolibacter sp.]
MTPPFISIVLPTYNRAALIGETIHSICSQTYQNWELLVIDDGSDDDTESVVKKIGDKRIRFYSGGRTGNIIHLRLKGMTLAAGELIAFMDSDDLWAPEKLQKQVNALVAFPDAGFSLTGGYNFTERDQPLAFFYPQKTGVRYGQVLEAFFRSEVAMIFPTLVFRSQCMDKFRATETCVFNSDVDFLIALAHYFPAVVLYEPLLFRRLHTSNNSSEDWEKGFAEKIVVIAESRSKKIISSSLSREALFKLYINFGEKYLQRKQQKKAVGKFWKAWQNRPFSVIPLKKTGKAFLSFFRYK